MSEIWFRMTELWLIYGSVVQFMLINIALALSTFAVMSTGVFSVAGVAFMAIGAYTSAIMTVRFGQSMVVGMICGVALSLIISGLLGPIVLRLRGHYLAIASLGCVMVVYAILMNANTLTGGALGLKGVPVVVETWQLILFVVILAYLFHVLSGSRVGRAWKAIRQDERAAASMGINVFRYRLLAFVLSAPIAAVAGSLFVHLTGFAFPSNYEFSMALNMVASVVLGGMNHWLGSVLGAAILSILPEALRSLSQYREIVNGSILVLTMIFLPRGLFDPRWLQQRLDALAKALGALQRSKRPHG